MGHEIYKRMVYSYLQPMWHALQAPSETKSTAVEVLENNFGGGFPVIVRPTFYYLNGELVEEKGTVIIRGSSSFDPEELPIGFCTERYNPLQPREIAEAFDANVGEHVETMAFLRDGREMFITWNMPEFDVRVGDTVKLYGSIKVGFDTLKGARLFTSSVRQVCMNTSTMAEAWAERHKDGNGTGMIWKGRAVNKDLVKKVGYWLKHVQSKALSDAMLQQDFFRLLANKPIKSEQEIRGILASAYPIKNDVSSYYPVELRTEKQEKVEMENMSQIEIRNGIYELFSGAGTQITPDGWGAFNATTEYFCHVQPSKKPVAESVMFGARQKKTMAMVNALSDWAR